jgi:hypothetical protein
MIKIDHYADIVQAQILTIQGHPELDREMTSFLMHLRLKNERVTPEEIVEAWERVEGTDGLEEGDNERAGWGVLEFMLQGQSVLRGDAVE